MGRGDAQDQIPILVKPFESGPQSAERPHAFPRQGHEVTNVILSHQQFRVPVGLEMRTRSVTLTALPV